MKHLLLSLAAALLLANAPTLAGEAGDPPDFMKKTFPESAVGAAFKEHQAIMTDPDSALDAKTKELIGIAVAGQVPCDYCTYYHRKAAQRAGATDSEIREALATAALVRKWSTVLNGSRYDMDAFRKEVDAMFSAE